MFKSQTKLFKLLVSLIINLESRLSVETLLTGVSPASTLWDFPRFKNYKSRFFAAWALSLSTAKTTNLINCVRRMLSCHLDRKKYPRWDSNPRWSDFKSLVSSAGLLGPAVTAY